MERKPRIFIGSSVESLAIADAINENLDHGFEVTIWRNGTFELSNNVIDSLVKKASAVDFAVFIFSPDDLATIRHEEKKVVRDNVIFELGLFIGTIGKERCFIVKPRNIELHFPTDLLGLNTADYEPNRSDNDLSSALNFACSKIKTTSAKIGLIDNANLYKSSKSKLSFIDGELSDFDFHFLSVLLPTITDSPCGYGLWLIKNKMPIRDVRVDLSSIKLERQGLIQKENDHDEQGYECYSYRITQDGLDILLSNELRLSIYVNLKVICHFDILHILHFKLSF